MKKHITKLNESEVVGEFPIKDLILGWYFACNEISSNAWSCRGTDLYGRKIGTEGSCYQTTLQEAVRAARKISRSLGEYDGMTINERLVVSGLMAQYDSAVAERDREQMILLLNDAGLTTTQCIDSVDAILNTLPK